MSVQWLLKLLIMIVAVVVVFAVVQWLLGLVLGLLGVSAPSLLITGIALLCALGTAWRLWVGPPTALVP